MEWVKCSERLPEVEGYYLIFCDNRRCLAEYYHSVWYTGGFIDECEGEREVFSSFDSLNEWVREKTTHWRPLPGTPKD
jgi:hypothetical protein